MGFYPFFLGADRQSGLCTLVLVSLTLFFLPSLHYIMDGVLSVSLTLVLADVIYLVLRLSSGKAGKPWLPSLFCKGCIEVLMKRQWPIYEETLAKATCKVRRQLPYPCLVVRRILCLAATPR